MTDWSSQSINWLCGPKIARIHFITCWSTWFKCHWKLSQYIDGGEFILGVVNSQGPDHKLLNLSAKSWSPFVWICSSLGCIELVVVLILSSTSLITKQYNLSIEILLLWIAIRRKHQDSKLKCSLNSSILTLRCVLPMFAGDRSLRTLDLTKWCRLLEDVNSWTLSICKHTLRLFVFCSFFRLEHGD